MSLYREQLETFLKELDVKADRVLDIGGGSNPVKGRTKSWDVKDYQILDNKVELPNAKVDIEADMNRFLCDDAFEIWRSLEKSCDIIFMLEVAEYLWAPLQALENIYSFLKEGGIAILTFPTTYPVHNPKQIDYLRYTKQGIMKLLQETGFRRFTIYPRIASPRAQDAYADFCRIDRLRAVKNDHEIYNVGYIVEALK